VHKGRCNDLFFFPNNFANHHAARFNDLPIRPQLLFNDSNHRISSVKTVARYQRGRAHSVVGILNWVHGG